MNRERQPPYHRHEEMPALYERQAELSALHFNHVQAALRHFRQVLRLPLPRLKTLDLILQPNAWIVVDRAFHDMPVVAWSHFETKHRDNLHQPIQCRLRLYHGHAGLILRRVLETMELLLGELMPESGDAAKRVVAFRKRDD